MVIVESDVQMARENSFINTNQQSVITIMVSDIVKLCVCTLIGVYFEASVGL